MQASRGSRPRVMTTSRTGSAGPPSSATRGRCASPRTPSARYPTAGSPTPPPGSPTGLWGAPRRRTAPAGTSASALAPPTPGTDLASGTDAAGPASSEPVRTYAHPRPVRQRAHRDGRLQSRLFLLIRSGVIAQRPDLRSPRRDRRVVRGRLLPRIQKWHRALGPKVGHHAHDPTAHSVRPHDLIRQLRLGHAVPAAQPALCPIDEMVPHDMPRRR